MRADIEEKMERDRALKEHDEKHVDPYTAIIKLKNNIAGQTKQENMKQQQRDLLNIKDLAEKEQEHFIKGIELAKRNF